MIINESIKTSGDSTLGGRKLNADCFPQDKQLFIDIGTPDIETLQQLQRLKKVTLDL